MHRARSIVVVLVAASLLLVAGCDRVIRVSRDAGGGDANAPSGPTGGSRIRGGVAIDGTGRVIAFESTATDLLPGGNQPGLFVRDLASGAIERIGAGANPDLTPDGRYLVYADQAYGASEVRRLDRRTGTTIVVSVRPDGEPSRTDDPNVANLHPSISDDGRTVAWESSSSDLVPGVTWNNVFVRDLQAGTTQLVSRAANGGLANETSHTPAISGDGRFVAFSSWASNLTVGDTPTGYREVYVRDLQAGTTQKANLDEIDRPLGFGALHPAISDDGRFVAFEAGATLWVRDLVAGTSEVASVLPGGGGTSSGLIPSMSGDGRLVAFASYGALLASDTNRRADVYVRDLQRDTTTRISVGPTGAQGPGDNDARYLSPAMSDDGFVAAFATHSPLDVNDRNDTADVFVRGARRPLVTSVVPTTLAPGTTTEVVVTGDAFGLAASVAIDDPAAPGAHVLGVERISDGELRVEVQVDALALAGARTVSVWNPTAEPSAAASLVGACGTCLTIE